MSQDLTLTLPSAIGACKAGLAMMSPPLAQTAAAAVAEMAEAAGIFKKVSTRYELPDGSKLFGKQILKNPEKHFTEDILNQIDNYTKVEYTYGRTGDDEIGGEEPEGDDTITDKESL